MATPGEAVYCTLLTSDHYLPGVVVLAHSLRDNGTRAKIVALFTPETLKESTVRELQTVYDEIIPVQLHSNGTPANLLLMDRLDLISTFTKIELWRQTQYSKIVYMDADVLALRAPDELLSIQEDFAAAPDIGWPDIFNSGVMVLRPNLQDYYALRALAERGTSFDGGDQGLLNTYFKRWHRLSFTYNCTPSGNYQYMPAYRHFESTISLIHFIGPQKPWTQSRHAFTSGTPYYQLLGRWWAQYDRHYRPLPTSLPPAPARVSFQSQPSYGTSSVFRSAPSYTSNRPESSFPAQNVHTIHQHETRHHAPPSYHEKPAQIAEDLHVLRRSPISEGFVDTTPAFAPAPALAHPQPIHPPSITHDLRSHHQAPVEAPAEVRSVVPLYVHGEEQSSVYVTVPSGGTENFTELKAQFITQKAFEPYHQHHTPVATAPTAQPQKAPSPPPPPPQQVERPFSPPRAEWDASREPPPRHSRPEALSLETQTYTMSEDTHLFRPPPSYPEAPKNMWYEVPSAKREPQKLAPIFPWETRASKPTRVFAEEHETSRVPSMNDVIKHERHPEQTWPIEQTSHFEHIEDIEHTEQTQQTEPAERPEPAEKPEQPEPEQPPKGTAATFEYTSPNFVPAESWETFSRGNAWDEVPEINKYVDAIQQRSKNVNGRGKAGGSKRPESLKITDFPTEVDRPSLPVTPAPIRRSFWGSSEEQQESSEFPAAEGVPNQGDWNPLDRLEELRQRQLDLFKMTTSPQGPTGSSDETEQPSEADK